MVKRIGFLVAALLGLGASEARAAEGGVIGIEAGALQQFEKSRLDFVPGWTIQVPVGYRTAPGIEVHLLPSFGEFGSNDHNIKRSVPSIGLGLRYYPLHDDRDIAMPWFGVAGGAGAILTRFKEPAFAADGSLPTQRDGSTLPVIALSAGAGIGLAASPQASFGLHLMGHAYVPTGSEAGDEVTIFAATFGIHATFSGLHGGNVLGGTFHFMSWFLR